MKKQTTLLALTLLALVVLLLCETAYGSIETTRTSLDGEPQWVSWDPSTPSTMFVRTSIGRLWRSERKTFADQSAKLPNFGRAGAPFNRTGIRGVIRTADPSRLYVIGFSHLWTTSNDGLSYQEMPFDPSMIISSIVPDPVEPNVALVGSYSRDCYSSDRSECNFRLFFTDDFGRSWRKIAGYVGRFAWATDEQVHGIRRIYATVYRDASGNQLEKRSRDADLLVSDDSFSSPARVIMPNTTVFIVRDRFVDVAYYSGDMPGRAQMYVSGNWGKSFDNWPLPPWNFGILLGTEIASQHMFVMQASQANSRYGNVWHSDESGANLVRSLPFASYLHTRGPEFHAAPRLLGVYFANVGRVATPVPRGGSSTSPGDAVVRVTRVTRNNGATWEPLRAPVVDASGRPTNCLPSRNCYLHLDLARGATGAFVTHPSAPGLIVGRGSLGESLADDNADLDMYVSNDGGSSWLQTAHGNFDVAVSEMGNVMVLLAANTQVSWAQYSTNGGANWHNMTLPADRYKFVAATASNSSNLFAFFGHNAIVMAEFTSTTVRACRGINSPGPSSSTDFEYWTPKDSYDRGCIVGHVWQVVRRKTDVDCFASAADDSIRLMSLCDCNDHDYECDVGYQRTPTGDCQRFVGNNIPDRDIEQPRSPARTRLVAGDVCLTNKRSARVN
jgi:Sortilin, neurotensin receptor 3,/Sortilin, neurotensin receptor 3, C-terminal